MTKIRKRTKITSVLLAFALALTMGPGMAFAEELPISKANGTVDVAENNNANPHHTDSCVENEEKYGANCGSDIITCPKCGEGFYNCQIDEASEAANGEDGQFDHWEYKCPACGEKLSFGESDESEIMPLAANNVISLTLPIVVTFGGSEGYDLANPQPSITSDFALTNNGKSPVMISGISTAYYNDSESSVTGVLSVADRNFNGTAVTSQNLFSLYPAGQSERAISFRASSTDITSSVGDFWFSQNLAIPQKSSINCTYRLNLTNNWEVASVNAKINESVANQGFKPLSQVTYTISTYTPAASGSTNSDFYLKDTTSNKVYSLSDVKGHALDLSAAGENSLYYTMYTNYAKDPTKYECKTKYDGVMYNLIILGVNHDNLTTGGKAGLTFMFKTGFLEGTPITTENSSACGWSNSSVRRQVLSEGGSFWNGMSKDVVSCIAEVTKRTILPQESSLQIKYADKKDDVTFDEYAKSLYYETTRDKLFLLGDKEVFTSPPYPDGDIYSFYKYYATSSNTRKLYNAAGGSISSWFRTPSPHYRNYWLYMNGGSSCNSAPSFTGCGINPAFCF
ncbi:DUF6273 domain-containing protein [Adlercreutzia sp. ZJ154]|uniref:DUF6273 domain-containing protein n=1 Tax=Adlercreutzia sp. ZJ154 TaxID=2709790 RepID=UPI0013ECB183|nr:DUF6273 domain-containing protein [Adlercreutzia sp. ZJ154]